MTHGGAAQRQLGEPGLHRGQPVQGIAHLLRVAAELLAETDRHGVLEMGAADLDDRVELHGLAAQSVCKTPKTRLELLLDGDVGRHVDGRGDHVVAGLAGVDVVVRVDRLLAADDAAEDLDGPVREDLVDVHVGRRGGAGLEDVEGKLAVEPPFDHFGRGLADGAGRVGRDDPQLLVDRGGLALDHGDRGEETAGQGQPGDREVAARPLGLGAVIRTGGDLHLAEAVFFDTRLGHALLLECQCPAAYRIAPWRKR
jgi:hypothetical protein